VADGGEDGIGGVSGTTFEIAAAELILGFHVADHGSKNFRSSLAYRRPHQQARELVGTIVHCAARLQNVRKYVERSIGCSTDEFSPDHRGLSTVSVHDDKLGRGLALTSRTLRYVDRASASRPAGLESRTGQSCDRPELKLEEGGVVIMWLRA
jgi:hypothetical protein